MSRHTHPRHTASGNAAPAAFRPDDVFVARQPILDGRQHTVAYQMLFRCGRTGAGATDDSTHASSQVINSALNLLGLAGLMDDHRVFIHATPTLLNNGLHELLPAGQAVLELDANTVVDDRLAQTCRKVRDAGYQIALHPVPLLASGQRKLLELADYLVVDFQQDSAKAAAVVENRPRQADVLARKVETLEAYEAASRIGCQLFQGFYFAKPHIVRRRNIASGKRAYLRFLHEVNRPAIDLDTLEQVIKQDAALACKLLRYLNSALFGLPNKLSSIRQALTLLGERPLRQWASLLALTHMGVDKAPALLHMSLVRARFCELLAPQIDMTGRELDMFLMGLLSTLDAMLDMEMHEIVPDLPLASDIKAAMLSTHTVLGKACALAGAYEQAQWTQITILSQELGVDPGKVGDIQTAALRWADEIIRL